MAVVSCVMSALATGALFPVLLSRRRRRCEIFDVVSWMEIRSKNKPTLISHRKSNMGGVGENVVKKIIDYMVRCNMYTFLPSS